jgi:hypothetical protein
MGEETPAFLWCRPLPDALEEDARGGAPARAVSGQHAPAGLIRERICEDGGTAVLAQRAQALREQGAVEFLESFGQRLNG